VTPDAAAPLAVEGSSGDMAQDRQEANGSAIDRLASAARSLSATDVLALIIVAGAWTGLARAAIGAPWYAALLDVAVAGLAIAALASGARDWRRIGLLGLLIACWIGLAAFEVLNPNVPSLRAGLEGFRKTAFTAAAFFIVALWPRPDGSRFYGIVAVGLIPAFLMAIRQFVAPTALDLEILGSSGISPITFHSGGVLRAFSPTAGPFHIGILGGAVLIISLVLLRRASGGWMLLSIVAAVALGLSLTRANLAAAFGCALLIAVLFRGTGRLRNIARLVPPAVASALAVLIAVGALGLPGASVPPDASPDPSSAPGASRAPTVGDVVGDLADPLSDKNLRFRFAFWAEFASAIAERPVIGYGTSAAADGFDHFYQGTGRVNFEPHSIYFKAALELGLIGLLLLLAILGTAAWLALKKSLRGDPIGMIAFGIVLLVAVTGVTGPMLDAYPANLLFWATCGWCARRATDEVHSQPSRADPG
jgi:O-antigen ligase